MSIRDRRILDYVDCVSYHAVVVFALGFAILFMYYSTYRG